MHLTLQKCGKCLSIFFYRSRVWGRLGKVKVLIYTDCSGSIDFLFECLSHRAFDWHLFPLSFSACANSHGSFAGRGGGLRKSEVNIPCWCTVAVCFASQGWCFSFWGIVGMQHWGRTGLCKRDILQCCKVKALVVSGLNEANSNELSRRGSLAPA